MYENQLIDPDRQTWEIKLFLHPTKTTWKLKASICRKRKINSGSGKRSTLPLRREFQKDANYIDFDSGFCSTDVLLLGNT